jgi:preprotein translocase subunit SecA
VIEEGEAPADWNLELLNRTILPIAPIRPLSMNHEDYQGYTRQKLIDEVTEKVKDLYAAKEKEIEQEVGTPEAFREAERVFLLKVIDNKWMNHIDDMDQLRQGIALQAYAQKDPVVEYRYAGIEMFEEMIASVSKDIVTIMLHIRKKPETEREQVAKVTGTNKDDSSVRQPVRRSTKKVSPNDPCPCGKCYPDGKPIKYKNCCGRNK